MKHIRIPSHRFIATALIAGLGASQVLAQPATVRPSPAEQRIAWAQKSIAAAPTQAQPHIDLAWALTRRAREISDPKYYDLANDAAKRALDLEPANLDARKVQVWALLGKHEFARALAAAVPLNTQVPDDVLVYGFLADAHAELGNYKDAEEAVQWMLDMRPANLSGLTRAAYLRELFGDVEGALELFINASNRINPTEVEDRAWILAQIGHLELSRGKTAEAEAALQGALKLFPRYHYALANLAKVRLAQKRPGDAVDLLRQLYDAAPHAEHLYVLAEALEASGNPEATRAYAEFETKALAESQTADNANRELVFYYIDHAGKPAEGLRIAQLERARRHDVHTLDAYAWALSATGDHVEARKQIEQALGVGIRDAALFYHAGAIASRLGDVEAARQYLENALSQNQSASTTDRTRKALDQLRGASAR